MLEISQVSVLSETNKWLQARDACAEADLSGSRLQSCIWDALASGDRDTAIQASIQVCEKLE
jgi:hypothetical protein